MIQIGGILSGFSLFALFTWLPIWRLANEMSAEGIFRYFVVVMMLVFGVFMISGGKNGFSLIRFTPAFLAGCLISFGYANGLWWIAAAGAVLFGVFWIFLGE
jgi:hypothetical protein